MSNLEFLSKYANCEDLHITKLDITTYEDSKPTMLFVDDSPATVTLFKRLVKRLHLEEDFNVLYSTGNDAGLRVLKTIYCEQDNNFKIDVILTDITFGGSIEVKGELRTMNGIELVGILTKVYPELIYSFITGHSIEDNIRSGLSNDFNAYNDNKLEDYVSYKDRAISTDKDLVYNILTGTKYEKFIK